MNEPTYDRQELITIVSALLATGHYSKVLACEDGTEEPRVRGTRIGNEWKEEGAWGFFQACAVEDALDILDEITKAIEANPLN
jgi:hypothetical protein